MGSNTVEGTCKHVIWLHCGTDPKGWNDPELPVRAQDFLEKAPHFEVVLDDEVIDCKETLARVSGVWCVARDDAVTNAAAHMPKCKVCFFFSEKRLICCFSSFYFQCAAPSVGTL